MQYRNFTLDKFQEDAIASIDKNHSVIVSAPTGSGKTLIADYIINRDIAERKKVIYTAPIKALSNQKYKEFIHQYGLEQIGILTGDVSINPTAPVIVMTTEIYRNMIMVNDPLVQEVSYIIFDEIHYISDIERGHIWEESIIFSPEHIRFLCLSATIPNAEQFAEWISTVKKHPVDVVRHNVRPVPLTHLFFDLDTGIAPIEELRNFNIPEERPRRGKNRRFEDRKQGPTHLDLIRELSGLGDLPCLYFVFSRAATQIKAEQLAKAKNFLSPSEQRVVIEHVREHLDRSDPQIKAFKTTKILREALSKGVGFHHGGLLPQLKEIVEHLFGEGLIKVLYTTETFAVGINMPAKAVCFDSLEKYDGISFRHLQSKEYFQLAGRAGRRGIDKTGKAISLVNVQRADPNKILNIIKAESEPLVSQFRLGYNTVLNLIYGYSERQIDTVLASNFGLFQRYGKAVFTGEKHLPMKAVFAKKKKMLAKMGYIDNEGGLTEKGQFARSVFRDELLVTELFYDGIGRETSEFKTLLAVAAVCYEPRRADEFLKGRSGDAFDLIHQLKKHEYLGKHMKMNYIILLAPFLQKWYEGCSFLELMKCTNLAEGDVIKFFRQMIDLMSQVKHASHDDQLRDKMDKISDRLNRELVEVVFE
ncbi:MAG: DEAD/DEAH box helicase [Nanoarchaeota archaeon]